VELGTPEFLGQIMADPTFPGLVIGRAIVEGRFCLETLVFRDVLMYVAGLAVGMYGLICLGRAEFPFKGLLNTGGLHDPTDALFGLARQKEERGLDLGTGHQERDQV